MTDRWTDGWTLDRYIALTALCGERSPFFAILFFFRLQIKYLTLNTNKYVVEVAES